MNKSFVKNLTEKQVDKIFAVLFPNQIFAGVDNEKKFIAKYNQNSDCLTVSAWDYLCFWNVSINLYNTHFEIPKYINSATGIQNDAQQKLYKKSMHKIFGNKYEQFTSSN